MTGNGSPEAKNRERRAVCGVRVRIGTQNDARPPETRPDPARGRAARVVAAAAAELTRKSHLRNRAGRRVYRRFRRDVAVDLSDPPSSAAFKRAQSARMTRSVA